MEILLRREPKKDEVHCVGECPNCQSIIKERISNLPSWTKASLDKFGYGGVVTCPVCENDSVTMCPISSAKGSGLLSKATIAKEYAIGVKLKEESDRESTPLLHHSV